MTSLSHQKLEVILSLQLLLRESSPIVPLNLMTLVWHPWHVWHPNSCYETIVSDKQKKEVPHIHLPWRVLVIIHTGHNSYHELEVKETYPIHQITKNTFNFVIVDLRQHLKLSIFGIWPIFSRGLNKWHRNFFLAMKYELWNLTMVWILTGPLFRMDTHFVCSKLSFVLWGYCLANKAELCIMLCKLWIAASGVTNLLS